MSELTLHFLGTGSGRPTLQRGSSSVGLAYGGEALLFDCGEGTQLQILRSSFRVSRADHICITHAHGDHLNGLPGLIGTLGLNGRVAPLNLVAPVGIERWFHAMRELSLLKPSFKLNHIPHNKSVPLKGQTWRLETVKLDHRISTYGFLFIEDDRPGRFNVEKAIELGVQPGPDFGRLQKGQALTLDSGAVITPADVLGRARPGRRVAYICDTRPRGEVIDAVSGFDVLIHEATYLHEFAEQARERGHSTVTEAAQVAAAAGVKTLILTHISPKHQREREILREARAIFPNTFLAHDLMEWNIPLEDD